MRLLFRILICNVFFVLFLFHPVWAANTSYYVDATRGRDSNTGLSHAQAWQTLSKVNNSLFNSGDNVYLLCGETWIGQQIIVDWSGTAEDNVIIGAYYMDDGSETVGVNGDGRPIIDGKITFPSTNTRGLVEVKDKFSYVTIQDLHILRSAGYGFIARPDATHVTVQRCKVDTTFRGSIVFWTNADNGSALYNECTNSGLQRLTLGNWPAAIAMRKTSRGIAKYNYVHDVYGEGIAPGNSGTVMYNLVSDTKSVALYINAVSDVEVAYNLVVGTSESTFEIVSGWHGAGISVATENNTSSWQDCYDNKVHHNVIINTYAGIRMYESHSTYQIYNIYIYNNTFIDNFGNFMLSNKNDDLDVSTIYVKNNISYPQDSRSSHVKVWGGSTIDNWTCDYNNWAVDTAPTNAFSGGNDVTGDPNFVKSTWKTDNFTMSDFSTSDFFVKDGSSAINSGVDLGHVYSLSIGDSSDFNFTDKGLKYGHPIYVNLVSQNDNAPWEMGATKLTGSQSSVIQPPEGLKLLINQ